MKQVITDHDLLNNSAFAGRDVSSASFEHLARRLVSQTRASLREGTELIDISVINRDRDLAVNLANWISQGFIRQHANQRLNMNRYAIAPLTNEAERLKIKLRNAEVGLIDFRRTSRLIVPLEERQSIVRSRVASLSQLKDSVDRDFERLKTDLMSVKSFGDEPSVSEFEQVPSVWKSMEVERFRTKRHEVEMKLEELTFRHKETHPTVTGEKRMLEKVEARLFESMKKQASGLEGEYLRMQKERDLLRLQLDEAEQESLTLSEIAVEYYVLEREVEGTRALYSSVLERIKEIDLTAGLMEQVITIVEPAAGARRTSGPNSSRIWGNGLIGLVLALAGVYWFDHSPFRMKVRREPGA